MKTRFIRNNRGQVAIFIALMFQVLFLFFAMIVNVGLLVHHKINLQNSVDIAAYYGASKQAEVLNAISHVNYQIRQSWKLLVWRQKVLGTAGIDPTSPNFPYRKLAMNQALGEVLAGGQAEPQNSVFKRPTFCITYSPHEIKGQGAAVSTENTCRFMYNSNFIKLPSANILYIPGFFNFGTTVAAAITSAANQAFKRCADTGALNYMIGGIFIAAHIRDSEERAYLMNYLATGLSVDENNFYELSGDQVKLGLEKTLKKNLTDANRATVDFEVYNSLAASSCRNAVGPGGTNQPQWMVPINTYPVWRYLDCNSNLNETDGTISSSSRQLIKQQLPALIDEATESYKEGAKKVSEALQPRPTLIGFEKDPWCVPYVGVRASAKPKIPFMPLSEVEITAEAYTKPFGGRMGPWYVKDWPQAVTPAARLSYKANSINFQSDRSEEIGPVRVTDLSGIDKIDDPAWAANIARFAGDTLGFSSERVLAYFHRALMGDYEAPNSYEKLSTGAQNYPFPVSPDSKVSLRYYEDIISTYSENGPRDSLTWDKTSNMAPRLRLMEIAALAPTIYDLNYYSIDPDFYNNYFTQIEKHKEKRGGWDAGHVLLGDYGWRGDTEAGKKMNIFDQIKIQRDVGATAALNSDISMPYAVKKASHLLNSWAVDNLLDYKINSAKFGECFSPASGDFETPMNPPTPGNCVDGGRVGNSVKLVSKDWLKSSDLELGGSGQTGAIRNPPPPEW